jgi:hypothetical protein
MANVVLVIENSNDMKTFRGMLNCSAADPDPGSGAFCPWIRDPE